MIVSLGGKNPHDARALLERAMDALCGCGTAECAHKPLRAFESAQPRPYALSRRAQKIERARMRAKVAGTRELTFALEVALATMRRDVLHRFGMREADHARIADGVGQIGFDERHLVKAFRTTVRAMFDDGVDSAKAELLSRPVREAGTKAYDDFDPQAALDALYGFTLDFSRTVVDRERDALKAMLLQAIADGLTGDEIRSEIRDFFADGIHYLGDDGKIARVIPEDAWIDMVARTEVARAQNAGITATYQHADIDEVVFVTAEDERVCPECSDLDGTVIPIGDDDDTPPIHPNCCPPGTMIATASGPRCIETIAVGDLVLTHRRRYRRVTALSRREVSENLVALRVGHRVLHVTENHPVYTGKRWTAAGALQPGDDICCVTDEAMLRRSGEPHDVPSGFAKRSLFDGILRSLARRLVPAAAIEFDRDLLVDDCNVDQRTADKVVRLGGDAGEREHVEEDCLVRGARLSSLRTQRAENSLVAASSSTHGIVRSRCEEQTILGRCLRHPHEHCIAPVALFQAETLPVAEQTAARDRHACGENFDRNVIADMPFVKRACLLVRQFAALFGNATQRVRASFGSCHHNVIVRLSGDTRVAYAGPVFNFAVDEDESYVANGVVVHNCRCTIVAAENYVRK